MVRKDWGIIDCTRNFIVSTLRHRIYASSEKLPRSSMLFPSIH
jgi:hypothetical protein